MRPATVPTGLQRIPETELIVHFEGYRDLPLMVVVVNEATDHAAYEDLRPDLLRSVRWAAYGTASESNLSASIAKQSLLQIVGAVNPKILLATATAAETVAQALEDRSLLVPMVILIEPSADVLQSVGIQSFRGHLLIIASADNLERSQWSDLSFPLAASFTKSRVAGSGLVGSGGAGGGSHPERVNPSSVNAVIAASLRKLRSTDALS